MDLVLKLNRSLYGLVQAPQCCFDKLSSDICQLIFNHSKLDQFIVYKENMAELVYVDNLIFFGSDMYKIYQVINKLKQIQLPLTV